MDFSGKTIALGVTGGIAAYKACNIVSLLKRKGADVHVVMTKNAREFITPLTLETLSGNRVITEMFDRNFDHNVKHISLAQKSDLFIVAPASANVIAKLAHGFADDFLSTTLLAYRGSVLLAPAMNTHMLENPVTRENIAALQARGFETIEAASGMLACGIKGKGRLATPEDIVAKAHALLNRKQDWVGKTVLVTAGATKTPIDPVRYITNHSSGKMGIAIAQAAANRGAKVIGVFGSVAVPLPTAMHKIIHVDTTCQMKTAVLDHLQEADIIIKAAAPSDYVVEENGQKLKDKQFSLKLSKGVDIAYEVGKIKGDKKLVIFAAETQDLIKNAKEKLKAKNADWVVANDITQVGAGFMGDTNIVTLLSREGETIKTRALEKMTKCEVAEILLDAIH